MDPTPIPDDEVVLRHIPGRNITHTSSGDQINSDNFRLRKAVGEIGVSVSRKSITDPATLMDRIGDPATGSRIAELDVRAIRALGFEVVPVPLPDDPGHAEIRSGRGDLDDRRLRRRLAAEFRFIDHNPADPA